MDRTTVRALNRINRAFYRAAGEEFSATRRAPWPGWERLLPYLEALSGPLSVLDVGCGNGRFGRFLAGRLARPIRYVGVDADALLLRRAREALAPLVPDLVLRRRDVVLAPPQRWAGGERFGLVAVFGVLHHVPGGATRRRLVEALAALVRPGGMLALAAWRVGEGERFARRVVAWEEYNRVAGEPIDAARLEPGDLLLRWGSDGRFVRYCHDLAPAELEHLTAGLALTVTEAFCADGSPGDLNRYLLLTRPAAPS